MGNYGNTHCLPGARAGAVRESQIGQCLPLPLPAKKEMKRDLICRTDIWPQVLLSMWYACFIEPLLAIISPERSQTFKRNMVKRSKLRCLKSFINPCSHRSLQMSQSSGLPSHQVIEHELLQLLQGLSIQHIMCLDCLSSAAGQFPRQGLKVDKALALGEYKISSVISFFILFWQPLVAIAGTMILVSDLMN